MSFGTTFGLSFAMGSALVSLSLLLGWVSRTFLVDQTLLQWILLPTLGYVVALGINSLVQQMFCGKINIKQLAVGATTIPIAVVLFLLLMLLGFVRAPVVQAVPLAYRMQYGATMALAFYMFWAGMFGEGLAGGFAQACPAS